MIVGSLYPPNCQSLSDSIIGSVVLRTNATSRRGDHGAITSHTSASSEHVADIESSSPPSLLTPAQGVSIQLSGKKRRQDTKTPSIEAIGEIQDADQSSYVAKLARAVQDHERNLAMHRERRRKNQVRYRMKQRELVKTLGEDVRNLGSEIQDLEVRRHNASIGIPTHQTLWTIATEYFLLFRHGFRLPPQALQNAALNFLRVSMAPDVVNGCQRGVEAILAKWRLFSDYFNNVHVELERLEKSASPYSLTAITITTVTISKEAMRAVFPHLNSDGKGGAHGGNWSPLGQRLLNQRLVMRGSVRFDWDSASDSVVSIQSQSDMLTPLLRVLDSLEDVSLVFEGALVAPDCRLASFDW
ncbi:hypothetical protein F441_14115 [Phytophthora nicotianae CJ01A1]|uniref:BZIP domain-containing protein n=2 Tax=Phytophthora nicotianae TaxID=4792 RepID=W2KPM0_PHYNI|nr:hypothetical protein L915_13859 [Phytophthora nicotianae]ETL33894.1 hypothetical protein L916_13756 [Phytophthora nicotianae]ETL87166.1 hypothetical protein L917_13563 [Phytophthora nicotianae]ETL87170.1 hypothetical protein L917_13562 [Phytophthora nicotianae]ETP10183.1 hypothetical protein F441_14115 [Phytophthora nicotianae CJ01A1]